MTKTSVAVVVQALESALKTIETAIEQRIETQPDLAKTAERLHIITCRFY